MQCKATLQPKPQTPYSITRQRDTKEAGELNISNYPRGIRINIPDNNKFHSHEMKTLLVSELS